MYNFKTFFQRFLRWESAHTAQSQEDSFELRLSLEILKSERFRLIIIIGLGIIAAGQAFSTEYLIPQQSRPLKGIFRNFSLVHWGLFMLGAVVYETIALGFVQKALKTRRMPPKIIRYMSLIIEVSFPTMLMLLLGARIHPIYAAHTPIILHYAIFIALSVLQLHFAASALSGFVAGAGYFFVCWHTLPIHGEVTVTLENYYFVSSTIVFAKSFLLFGMGIITGLVAYQLRKTLIRSLLAQEEKNAIVGMFGQYVSPSVAEKLIEQKQHFKAELTGEERRVTVMFLDIRDFTSFSEKRSPQEVVQYLNTLFGHCIGIINKHNGIVNKFLGDGFMAVFGAPFSSGSASQDVHNAVSAMQEILKTIDSLNDNGLIPETQVGIGLHTGVAVTGSVGSDERKEYTIIGDTVNLASRLEQMTKQLSVRALLTDAVYEYLSEEARRNISCKPLPPLKVRGREEAVTVYQAL